MIMGGCLAARCLQGRGTMLQPLANPQFETTLASTSSQTTAAFTSNRTNLSSAGQLAGGHTLGLLLGGLPLHARSRKPGRGHRKRDGFHGVVSFFNLFGGGKKSVAAEEDESERRIAKYRNVPLPFPESLVDSTFLGGRELACCYRASEDGFSAADFHSHCDFKGPCFVVALSEDGARFGGFSPEGFRSTDDYYDSLDAFLFFWPTGSDDPVVLPKVGGGGAALFDYARGGPQFGADGLLLGPPLTPVMGGFSGPDSNKGVGSLTEARSRLGLSYAKRPDGLDSLFGEQRKAVVVEVEVFCSPQIAALY